MTTVAMTTDGGGGDDGGGGRDGGRGNAGYVAWLSERASNSARTLSQSSINDSRYRSNIG